VIHERVIILNMDFVRTPAPSTAPENQYGGHFWLVPDRRTDLPQDAYSTNGARGQYTVIVPSYRLVIVRRGLARSDRGVEPCLLSALDAGERGRPSTN